ncbi:MAG: hypothetical protein U0931_16590 [Vulcanimicrobiota bacterium]
MQMLSELEDLRGQETQAQTLFAKVDVPPMTDAQRSFAVKFLTRTDLFQTILDDMEALGYLGVTGSA